MNKKIFLDINILEYILLLSVIIRQIPNNSDQVYIVQTSSVQVRLRRHQINSVGGISQRKQFLLTLLFDITDITPIQCQERHDIGTARHRSAAAPAEGFELKKWSGCSSQISVIITGIFGGKYYWYAQRVILLVFAGGN